MSRKKKTAKKRPLPLLRYKPEKPQMRRNRRTMRAGEPWAVVLTRWEGDLAYRGHEFQRCCGCGLRHFTTYEVYEYGGELLLQTRSWRSVGMLPERKVSRG